MRDRGDQGKQSVPVGLVFSERDGFERPRKKSVGRLLIDGGTVEEPSRQHLGVPRRGAALTARWWRKK
jgi:hypothetical protein